MSDISKANEPLNVYEKAEDRLHTKVVSIMKAKSVVKTWLSYSDFTKPRTLQLGLEGESGVGKTQCVKQAIDELGTHYLLVLRMSNMDEGQINGYPAPTPQKTIKLCMLDQYKEKLDECEAKGKKLVIMFDELNRAKPQAIRTVFNIIERKMWAGVQLPEDTAFIVATNPPTGIHQVQDIWGEEAALNSRFTVLGVKTDVSDFLEYIRGNKRFHWVMREYVVNNPLILEDFENMYNGKNYTCPAVIECIGEYLYAAEEAGEDLRKIKTSTSGIKELIRGAGGTPFATSLFDFVFEMDINISPRMIVEEYSSVRNRIKKALGIDVPTSEIVATKEVDSMDVTRVSMLAKKVAEYVGSHTPDLKEGVRASNLAAFMSDLPDESLASFVDTVKVSSDKRDKSSNYLETMARSLMAYPDYTDNAARRLMEFQRDSVNF